MGGTARERVLKSCPDKHGPASAFAVLSWERREYQRFSAGRTAGASGAACVQSYRIVVCVDHGSRCIARRGRDGWTGETEMKVVMKKTPRCYRVPMGPGKTRDDEEGEQLGDLNGPRHQGLKNESL